MKKYFVLKMHRNSTTYSSVVFNTDDKNDAVAYAEIMNRNADEGDSYHVAEFV